jgi:hypothetical protein
MGSNAEIIRKADMSVSQLASDGGKLPIEKAREFVARTISHSKFLSGIRLEEMAAEEKELPDLAFAARVLRPKASGDALPPSDRVRPNIGKGTLVAKEFGFEAKIPLDVLEENIEGEGILNTIQSALEEAIARDLEEVVLRGDTASSDAFLARFDGLVKLAATNTTSGGSAHLSDALLDALWLQLPQEARSAKESLRIATSTTAEFRWRRSVAARMTALGDTVHQDGKTLTYNGIMVDGYDLFPQNLGGGGNETVALLYHHRNAVYGIRREIRIGSEFNLREQAYYLVGSLKAACTYVHEPHTAKLTAILSV